MKGAEYNDAPSEVRLAQVEVFKRIWQRKGLKAAKDDMQEYGNEQMLEFWRRDATWREI